MRPAFTQESDFRQRRDFGQKFSATFEFIAAHWRGLGRCLLYLVLPAALLRAVAAGLLQQQNIAGIFSTTRQGGGRSTTLRQIEMMSQLVSTPLYWVSIALGIAFATMLVLTVYGYVKLCLRPYPSAEPIMPRDVWQVVKQDFISSFFSYLGIAFIVVIGLFFLAIPGIYLAVALMPFFIIKVVEGTGFGATLSRSLSLTKGKWWSTFGLLAIMVLMLFVVLMVIGAFSGMLTLGLLRGGWNPGAGGASGRTAQIFLISLAAIGSVLNLLFYPPMLLAIAFQYFNLVERRDGTGLHQLVNQIGQAPAPVQNATLRADEEGEY
ncbi:hypothetical protein MON38_03450 [Hymenobacter sp. DH14]|uniref:Glycerophosphoryl diester phosphodiesterase membrane domain-containing protein n=1 Tax=Hymenobacter cyanobacteriorum TaxID=2926463 RepID=A0A9X2AFG2_9BACT|nr:hypothetical protein [Hymenobacter cyanobacteriorum]MCI1186458.1 hypothetical protein [Hymenobacter cyanobacteriorum]